MCQISAIVKADAKIKPGVIGLNLIELLSASLVGKYNKTPNSRFQMLENQQAFLSQLKAKNIRLVNIGAEDLHEGNNHMDVRMAVLENDGIAAPVQPLSALETGQYIAFRLGQCGYNGPALFSSKAVDLLFRTAHGTPRMINVIAHKSLMAAFADQSQEVLPVHIQRAVADGQYGQDTAERAPSLKLASWLTLVATLLFAAAVYWRLV